MAVALSGSIVLAGSITGSLLGTASYSSNTEFFDGLDSSVFALTSSLGSFTSSLNDFSSSINTYTASNNANIAALNAATASLYNATASLYSATASLYGATSSLFTYSASATSRINALDQYTASLNTRSASFACINSTNNFACVQYFSNASNAVSFTSTGSLYSDGGMRLTKDLYVSGTSYFNNVTIFGTQSVNYITSSQLNIASNIITVNTATPTVRFGGLAVYDSGSLGTGLTGSILWDSEDNQWIYSNPSGSAYDSALFLVGPRNSGVLGGEAGISCNFLSKGNGMHHMTSSGIFEDGSRTCFYGQSFISSSGNACFSGQVCSNTVSTTDGTNTSTLANNYLRYNGGDFYVDACAVGGNFRIRTSNASALDNTALFICGGNSNIGIGTATPSAKLDVAGNITLTNAANPSFTFCSSDSAIINRTGTNSGLYFQKAGSTQLVIDTNSNVGINMASPLTKLHIQLAGTTTTTCMACLKDGALVLYNANAGSSTNGTVGIFGQNAGALGLSSGIGFSRESSANWGTQLRFYTHPTTTSEIDVVCERMRITGDGCISVGTTCTLGRLTIASEAGTSGITLLNTTAATLGTETQFITWEGLTNGSALHACPLGRIGVINVNGGTSIGTMVFYTKQYNAGICERMRITSDGNVGIGGLPGDGYRLQVVGTSQAQTTISQTYAGVSAAAMKITSGGDWAVGVDLADGGTNRFRITSTGIACFACQVCAPQLYACVSSAAAITIDGYSKLSFADRGTEYGTINASRYNFGGESTLMTFQSSKCFLFLSGLNCLMFINTANSNVGIGNTSPLTKLVVNNTIAGAILPYVQGTGLSYNNEGISVAGSNTNNTNIGNGLTLYNNVASVGAYGPVVAWSSMTVGGAYNATYAFITGVYGGAGGDNNWAIGDLILGTAESYGATERMRIRNNGNVGINNSSPSYRLDICTAQSIRVRGSSTGYTQGSIIFQSSTTDTPEARGLGVYAFNEGTDATWFYGTAYNAADTFVVNRKAGTTYQEAAASVGESSTFLSINNTGRVGLNTTNVSTEANLFLGAQGAIEGGQLVLQKGTSCSCATHLDNYQDSFRVLVGSDTTSTGVNMVLDHKTRNVCFYGGIVAGAVYATSGYVNETQTISTSALVYSFNKDQGAAGGSSSTTFNITGLPNADGAFAFIFARSSNTAAGINVGMTIQVNGNNVFSTSTQNVTKCASFTIFRQNGTWTTSAAGTGGVLGYP